MSKARTYKDESIGMATDDLKVAVAAKGLVEPTASTVVTAVFRLYRIISARDAVAAAASEAEATTGNSFGI
ncbi:hypothetical protein C8034_v005207 [Colletotrichum sidae]|uniref:Uncharacterized protein n=2 Tax=Colletotrichum orbiculare species complex TaxID=2707354 RepID=A0A4R8PKN6_9PEZI|nr:hypothetical protein C8035_v000184 [Colletotrichum spinosum]TEA22772.1 hypothetical protein C8034_v005207 [Colletotrichum sidae]